MTKPYKKRTSWREEVEAWSIALEVDSVPQGQQGGLKINKLVSY